MSGAAGSRRPFVHGILFGAGLPLIVLIVLALAGRLSTYLSQSRAYAALPFFALLGFVTLVVAMRRYEEYRSAPVGSGFATGTLLAGSVAGILILFLASAERPIGNRIVYSVFGGPLLIGFWEWAGAILGLAIAQSRTKGVKE